MFITSSNLITVNGELVNIYATCNRISAMTFGPKQVIVIPGRNKIVQDVPAAIGRIKNFVAPMNAKRLGVDVPCAKLGKCVDCNSPNRICRAVVIHE